ncbi:NUDIX pyrophosphatase [Balneolaceae bacterium YR4-1]|uniref:NUDIX pyrophosphatase n=1 Tax=Halalkalibaculum roseum TaxID=2709311 RepID=A0A6M1T851_9BACT|nr:NUDIX pyrophosphatase [Halalkalibaculum roseum]NGP76443.1 NUDIX pyrophosphatase [Halalkalibaculum roseum]
MRLVDVYPYRMQASEVEFLILKRSSHKIYAGQWRMIGGKIEDNEQAWEAGLRELKEETTLSPLLYWVIPSINHFYNHRNNEIELIPAFAAELQPESEIKLNEEHSEYKWIDSWDVDDYLPWPEQKRLLKLAHEIISNQKILEDWIISI